MPSRFTVPSFGLPTGGCHIFIGKAKGVCAAGHSPPLPVGRLLLPSSHAVYSNTNYKALGRVVEVVSGESYRQYIQHHLFDPAGMSQSATIVEENAVENMAIGFASDPNDPEHIVPALPFNPGWAWSAGYIVSTVGDLELWDTALRNGRIISLADYALMTTPFQFPSDTSAHYGFGLSIDAYIDHGSFNEHPRF
jgi:CubicO group peptidase (beta-lactamase class C family)